MLSKAISYVIHKYEEAIAITVENDARQELGYSLRTDIGFDADNQEGYGVFPQDLTNNDFANHLEGTIVAPGEVIKASVPYQYREGIVNYILQKYKQ